MWRKSSALFGLHICGIILNPVCFTISFNIPDEVAVKGEHSGTRLGRETMEPSVNGCGLFAPASSLPWVLCAVLHSLLADHNRTPEGEQL